MQTAVAVTRGTKPWDPNGRNCYPIGSHSIHMGFEIVHSWIYSRASLTEMHGRPSKGHPASAALILDTGAVFMHLFQSRRLDAWLVVSHASVLADH